MKKAEKEILLKYETLESQANQIIEDGVVDPDDSEQVEIFDALSRLREEYDFSNEVYTDVTGMQGVKWCWGEVMIPAIYDVVNYYDKMSKIDSGCYAIATRNGKDYLVEQGGNEIFEADEILPNAGGLCPVKFRVGDKWGVANSHGNVLINPKYDEIHFDSNGYVFYKIGDKNGFSLADKMFEPMFDSIEFGEDDVLVVELNGEKGYLDENGVFTTDSDKAYYRFDTLL